MSKIPKNTVICVFPLSGKSTAAKRFKNVIDLESSRYMFEDSFIDTVYNGNEELAKGDPNRVRLPDADQKYLEAVLKEVHNPQFDYVLCGPTVLKDLVKQDIPRSIYLVQPQKRTTLVEELMELAIERGNRKEWRENFIPMIPNFLDANPKLLPKENYFELKQGQFLSDIIDGIPY